MSVIEVNDTNYIREVQNSDLPVLLDFYATWCGPCQMLSPTIHALAEAQEDREAADASAEPGGGQETDAAGQGEDEDTEETSTEE